MSTTPLLLTDNLFSPIIYPLHTRSADEEANGHEVQYLADGRRSVFDYWTPTTPNAQHTVVVTSNLVLNDRGFESGVGDAHTHGGSTIVQSASQHHSGADSLKVTTANSTGSGAYFRHSTSLLDGYAVTQNLPYIFTVWVISSGGGIGKTLQLGIEWTDANGAFISTSLTSAFATTGSWAAQSLSATAPAGAVLASLTCYTDTTEGIFDFYLDDISFGQSFAPTAAFLDRGHNIPGIAGVKYQVSSEGTAYADIWTVTIPGAVGTDLTAANGATTEEGAWGKVWSPGTAGTWHRLLIPAMGTGRIPVIVGLWLGLAWQPDFFFMPSSEEGQDFTSPENVTEWGWRGRGPAVATRSGTISVKFASLADYATARPTLIGQYAKGRPMWICYNQAQADRAFLAVLPQGARFAPRYDRDWFPLQAEIPYVEWEPKRA